MVKNMRGFIDLCRSRKGRIALNVSSAVLGIGVAVLAAQHFAETGWPLANADFQLVAAAGGFFLLSHAFKAFGWHRLFASGQRPHKMALAAAGRRRCSGRRRAPGRFDDVVRVAVVRRFGASDSCVGTVRLSLFMLGLIDTAAPMPLASSAAATSDSSVGVCVGMGVVAAAGLASAIIISVLPRLMASGRLIRFRIARWLADRTTATREAWKAMVFVLACWVARAVPPLLPPRRARRERLVPARPRVPRRGRCLLGASDRSCRRRHSGRCRRRDPRRQRNRHLAGDRVRRRRPGDPHRRRGCRARRRGRLGTAQRFRPARAAV